MTDELLPTIERIITRRYGQPMDQLYAHLTRPDPDLTLARILAWHQRLIHTDAYLQRCEDALLPHLAHDTQENLTPQQHQERAHAAYRLALAAGARDAVVTTLLNFVNTPAHGTQQPAPRVPRLQPHTTIRPTTAPAALPPSPTAPPPAGRHR